MERVKYLAQGRILTHDLIIMWHALYYYSDIVTYVTSFEGSPRPKHHLATSA